MYGLDHEHGQQGFGMLGRFKSRVIDAGFVLYNSLLEYDRCAVVG